MGGWHGEEDNEPIDPWAALWTLAVVLIAVWVLRQCGG